MGAAQMSVIIPSLEGLIKSECERRELCDALEKRVRVKRAVQMLQIEGLRTTSKKVFP